jgi:hypothetical protein
MQQCSQCASLRTQGECTSRSEVTGIQERALASDSRLNHCGSAPSSGSRKLHPSKLDAHKLGALLDGVGAREALIKPISFGWALAAFARRRA